MQKKTIGILLSFAILLIGIRIYLPFFLTDYVNKTLQEIPEYTGSVKDIDVALIRGAYVIEGMEIFKTDGGHKKPFFSAKTIDLSLEWKSLFKGAIVGEVALDAPELNFILASDSSETDQFGTETDWTKPIRELMPLTLNSVVVYNGAVHYIDRSTTPEIDIYLEDFQAQAFNLNNVDRVEKELPSTITAKATSHGEGVLDVEIKIDLLRKVPNFDLNLNFEQVNLVALNDLLEAYAQIDIEEGELNLFSEFALSNGKVEGYIKPVIHNMKVLDFKKDKKKPFNLIWQAAAEGFTEVFKNHKRDQFATKIPILGKIEDSNVKLLPSIVNIWKNAFISAFEKNIDNTIDYDNVKN